MMLRSASAGARPSVAGVCALLAVTDVFGGRHFYSMTSRLIRRLPDPA